MNKLTVSRAVYLHRHRGVKGPNMVTKVSEVKDVVQKGTENLGRLNEIAEVSWEREN